MRSFYFLLASALLALPARAQTVPTLPADQVRLEAIYRLTYRPDSTAPATRTELMRLQIGSKASRFESLTALRADSALMVQIEASVAQAKTSGTIPHIKMESSYRSAFRGQAILKVPAAKQVVVTDKIEQSSYAYAEPFLLFWTIVPGTAPVAGYACQRATTTWGGRRWEAWFTREVPIAEGPYKFYGLPGLIVQMADTRQHYRYELVKLRQLLTPMPLALPDVKTKPITKADFLKAKDDNTRSMADRMLANGNIRFNTPEEETAFRQKARERAKRPTNPIELK